MWYHFYCFIYVRSVESESPSSDFNTVILNNTLIINQKIYLIYYWILQIYIFDSFAAHLKFFFPEFSSHLPLWLITRWLGVFPCDFFTFTYWFGTTNMCFLSLPLFFNVNLKHMSWAKDVPQVLKFLPSTHKNPELATQHYIFGPRWCLLIIVTLGSSVGWSLFQGLFGLHSKHRLYSTLYIFFKHTQAVTCCQHHRY